VSTTIDPGGLIPYGPPLTGPTDTDAAATARAVLRDGFVTAGRDPVPPAGPVPWSGNGDRSFARKLHGWRPIEPLLRANDVDPDGPYLDAALKFATIWLDHEATGGDPMSWYDLAAGQRAYRLAYLADALRFRTGTTPDRLTASLDDHARRLLDDGYYAGHSNHGLYQIAGMLALARRFPNRRRCARAGVVGRRRLGALIDDQFAADGIHREHSPGYHAFMLRSLAALLQAGMIADSELVERCAHSEAALAWFVTPDGCLARFGDTHSRPLSAAYREGGVDLEGIATRWQHPAMRYAVSGGRIGAAPDATTVAFRDGGFAVVRSHWPDPEDATPLGYLAMTAAFHSRTHKHADDLAIVWFDAGRALLVDAGNYGYVGGRIDPDSDAGRLGYWYDDPNRMFVESTAAHNTVRIDGTDQDRRRRPYGSGISAAGHVVGDRSLRFAVGTVSHGSIVHRRIVLAAFGRWLLVVDDLTDPSGTPHVFEQRFHAAPDLGFESAAGSSVLREEQGPVVWAASASPAEAIGPERGVAGPPMRGWHSPGERAMVPAWTFGWQTRGATALMATLFSLEGPTAPPTVSIIAEELATSIPAIHGPIEVRIGAGEPTVVHRVG
jgi:hypothetical protein